LDNDSLNLEDENLLEDNIDTFQEIMYSDDERLPDIDDTNLVIGNIL
jgi:hypothetical protein